MSRLTFRLFNEIHVNDFSDMHRSFSNEFTGGDQIRICFIGTLGEAKRKKELRLRRNSVI